MFNRSRGASRGNTYPAQTVKPLNVVTANTVVRNVHSKKEKSVVGTYIEGSEVLVLEKHVKYYPIPLIHDWMIGFSSKPYYRLIAGSPVKAIDRRQNIGVHHGK